METIEINKRELLLEHQYSSRKLDIEEVDKVEKADFECEMCGKSVFEMDDFPETDNIDDYNCLCEECYDEEYRTICSCCEESYEQRDESVKYLVFTPDNFETANIERAGIYRVKTNPYFTSDYFSSWANKENIKLIRECNVESMLKHIRRSEEELNTADEICQTCAEKYAMITPLAKASGRYVDKFTRIHCNINVKGIIERGF